MLTMMMMVVVVVVVVIGRLLLLVYNCSEVLQSLRIQIQITICNAPYFARRIRGTEVHTKQ